MSQTKDKYTKTKGKKKKRMRKVYTNKKVKTQCVSHNFDYIYKPQKKRLSIRRKTKYKRRFLNTSIIANWSKLSEYIMKF